MNGKGRSAGLQAVAALGCVLVVGSNVALAQTGAWFSFQGSFAPGDAVNKPEHEFRFTSSATGAATFLTLHNYGGVNAAGDTIPGGSFDPMLYLRRTADQQLLAFNDNYGPGLDSYIAYSIDAIGETYSLRMVPYGGDVSSTKPWALDVRLPGNSFFSSNSYQNNLSSLSSVSFGADGGAVARFNPANTGGSDHIAYTVKSGGLLDIGNATVAIGSLSGNGTVLFTGGTLTVGTSTFGGTLAGTGTLVTPGMAINDLGTLAGEIRVNGGTLQIPNDTPNGGAPGSQIIQLQNNATFLVAPQVMLSDPVRLSPNRSIHVAANQTGTVALDPLGSDRSVQDDRLRLEAPNQLQNQGTMTLSGGECQGWYTIPYAVLKGGIEIAAANPNLQGQVITVGRIAANAPGALGTAAVRVDAGPQQLGVLQLNAAAAVGGPLTVNGTLEYNATGALGGGVPALINSTLQEYDGGYSYWSHANLQFGPVTSVGSDRFIVRAQSRVMGNVTVPGMLQRGQNIILDPDAVVDAGMVKSISNLGAASDLWLGAVTLDPFTETRDLGNVTVGLGTPFKGITAAGSTRMWCETPIWADYGGAAILGSVTATSDIVLESIRFSGDVTAASPIRVELRDGVRLDAYPTDPSTPRGTGPSFNNVTLDVTGQWTRVRGGCSASALNIAAGASLVAEGPRVMSYSDPVWINVGALTGSGTITSSWDQARLTVGIGDVGSTFSGTLGIAFVEKVGTGSFVLAGKQVSPWAPYIQPNFILSGGSLSLTVGNSISRLTTAGGTTAELGATSQLLDQLTHAGTMNINGGQLTCRSGSISGTINGTGDLTLGSVQVSSSSPFVGPLTINGDTTFSGSGALPNITSLRMAAGGRMTLDYRPPRGAGSPIPTGLPLDFDGGGIRVIGPDGGALACSFGAMRFYTPPPDAQGISFASGTSSVECVAGAGGTASLTFASLGARPKGTTVNFIGTNLGTTNQIKFIQAAGTTTPPAGFLGGWAIANGADFAKYDASKGVIPFDASDYGTNPAIENTHLRVAAGPVTVGNTSFRTLTLAPSGTTSLDFLQSPYTTLDVSTGGVLKTGAASARIAPSAGFTPKLTSSAGELIFHAQEGDLTVTTPITGAVALTKSGPGRLILDGTVDSANTYTGATYVNQGELLLNKTAVNRTIGGTDVIINGGTLQLGAAEQINDNAIVRIRAGRFVTGAFNETVKEVRVEGGRFEVGAGATPSAPADPAARGVSGGGVSASETVVGTVTKASITNSDVVVNSGATLYVGASGLTFNGKGISTVTLNGGGTTGGVLDLHGNVYVEEAGTRASIVAPTSYGQASGKVNLNGLRVFVQDSQTTLTISAPLTEGNAFDKDGPGKLRLEGGNSFAGRVRVNDGTLEVGDGNAIRDSTMEMTSLLGLAMRLRASANATAMGGNFDLRGDTRIETEAILAPSNGGDTPPPTSFGPFQLRQLIASQAARLTVRSVNGVPTEFQQGMIQKADVTLSVESSMIINQGISADPANPSARYTLTKDGAGTLTLSGSSPNVLGAMIVQKGTVELNKPAGVTAVPTSLQIKGGATVRLKAANPIADAAPVEINGAGSILDLNGHPERLGMVTLIGGGRLVFGTPASAFSSSALPSRGTGMLILGVVPVAQSGGAIDLANNSLIQDYVPAGPSPLDSVRQLLQSGFAAGAWNGGGMITSAGAANASVRVGYGEASALLGISGTSTGTWQGQTVDASSILMTMALTGDTNLDDHVDFTDLVAVAQHYNQSGQTWLTGDLNYDGIVNFADLVAVAQNYNKSLSATAWPGAVASPAADATRAFGSPVPEPSLLAPIAMIIGLCARRPRP